MSAARRVQMVKAKDDDAFPAITILAAVPATFTDDGQLTSPVIEVPPETASGVAVLLAGVLREFSYGIRPLAVEHAPWTHFLRIIDENYPPSGPRDFVVQVAGGFPANELEAAAHGLEYAELFMGTVDPDAGTVN